MSASIPTPLAWVLGGPVLGLPVEQAHAQKRAMKESGIAQKEAQRLATTRAAAEMRRQEMEQRRANRKKPDISSLLGAERQSALTGPGATMLTGAAGVSRQRLTLGSSSLLGG